MCPIKGDAEAEASWQRLLDSCNSVGELLSGKPYGTVLKADGDYSYFLHKGVLYNYIDDTIFAMPDDVNGIWISEFDAIAESLIERLQAPMLTSEDILGMDFSQDLP